MSKKRIVLGYFLLFLSIIVLIAPVSGLFIHNREIWIEQDATKLSMGLIVGLIYGLFVIKGALKEISPKAGALLSMGVFAVIIKLFDSIIASLFVIVLALMAGYVGYIILSTIGSRLISDNKIYREERIRVKARKTSENDCLGV